MDPVTIGGIAAGVSAALVSSSASLFFGSRMLNRSQAQAADSGEVGDYSLKKKKTLIAAREILETADAIESEPNNGIKGRFIKIENPNRVCMHIANIIVSTNKNDNIAYEKPVTISSVLDKSDKFKPSNATDNDNNTYVHSSCGEAPWLIVDLQFVADIVRITIVNRQDCCQHRINGSFVSILGEQHETVWESQSFVDGNGSPYPVSDSNLNQYGFDSFTMYPPDTQVVGEKNQYY